MTAALAILLVLVVAAFIVLPLLAASNESRPEPLATGSELWNREKAVAVLAISEADFDLATGKLSDEDYRVLRTDYEGRALHAMDEIDRMTPGTSPVLADRFCGGCGSVFSVPDAFCGHCGRPRSPE